MSDDKTPERTSDPDYLETLARGLSLGMKIDRYLDRNDAYGYFRALDDLVVTGPTHTNVNDFRAILVL